MLEEEKALGWAVRVERNRAQWGMCAHVPVQASAGDCISSCVMGNMENRNNQEFQKEGTQVALTKTSQNGCTGHTHMYLSDAGGGRGRGGQIWESTAGVGTNGSREWGGAEAAHGWAGGGQVSVGAAASVPSSAEGSAVTATAHVTSHLCGGHSPRSRGASEGTGLQGCHLCPGSEVSAGAPT